MAISPYAAGVTCSHFYPNPDINQATLGSEWSLNLRPPRHGHLTQHIAPEELSNFVKRVKAITRLTPTMSQQCFSPFCTLYELLLHSNLNEDTKQLWKLNLVLKGNLFSGSRFFYKAVKIYKQIVRNTIYKRLKRVHKDELFQRVQFTKNIRQLKILQIIQPKIEI